ncbi:retinoblastoma-associated protein-like [Anneissia japonica]|uniref:retinoblastoma-associated protein-like n=1 Tax=Anneissia japonica TaxID=1529436 RepID=UPI001425B564|nr:retinoblastoma-associated protein-like [Anneissia japonica]
MQSDEEFNQICKQLEISVELSRKAQLIWKDWMDCSCVELKVQPVSWIPCAIYVTVIEYCEQGSQGGPTLSITQILEISNMNIVMFFKKMNTLKAEHMLSRVVIDHLLKAEQKYCIAIALFQKMERIFRDVFQSQDAMDNNYANRELLSSQLIKHTELCWTMFILTKGSLFDNCNDLLTSFQLMVGCIDHVIKQVPVFLLRERFSTRPSNLPQSSEPSSVLRILCEHVNCVQDYQDVANMQMHHLLPFLDTLEKKKAEDAYAELTEIAFLQRQYQEVYKSTKDIDELHFLLRKSYLFPEKPRPPLTPPDSTARYSRDVETPVKRAINTIQGLKNLLNSCSASPSPKLLQYFKQCQKDPTSAIKQRLSNLERDFIQNFASTMGIHMYEVARQRFQIGCKLYFRVMEAMLTSEAERLKQTNFSKLLCNETFHKSLLACSLEVVLLTYGTLLSPSLNNLSNYECSVSFPWILGVFKIEAYDFCKVIETFLKEETKLTRDAVKHLQNVEAMILDSLAWKSGSPLFDAMSNYVSVSTTSPFVPPNSGEPCTTPIPKNTASEMFQSPLKPSTKVGEGTPTRSFCGSAGSSTEDHSISPKSSSAACSARGTRSPSLNVYITKVLHLAYERLQELCTNLDIAPDLILKIWTCLEQCILHKPLLLKDRHLDQIMMCSIYAICKVVEQEKKFKNIVAVYRMQPHASQTVYKQVLVEEGEFDSIISFYNRIFMPSLKTFVLQFQPSRQSTPNLSPVPSRSRTASQGPQVYVVPGKSNLYISPMKDSPFKSPLPIDHLQMTPTSKLLYNFGESGPESTEKLRQINEVVQGRGRDKSGSSSQKRLKFEVDLEESSEDANKNNMQQNNSSSGKGPAMPSSANLRLPDSMVELTAVLKRRVSELEADMKEEPKIKREKFEEN